MSSEHFKYRLSLKMTACRNYLQGRSRVSIFTI